jgi:hypothetical protein
MLELDCGGGRSGHMVAEEFRGRQTEQLHRPAYTLLQSHNLEEMSNTPFRGA